MLNLEDDIVYTIGRTTKIKQLSKSDKQNIKRSTYTQKYKYRTTEGKLKK